MKFRPCIDLRNGKVVQIVGSTLCDKTQDSLVTNFESTRTPEQFARMYRADQLAGGHVIALGPGNIESVLDALKAFPGGLQMGGGINPENAHTFLDAGASHVIVTSYVFSKGRIDTDKLNALVNAVGRNHLVLDLSCRKRDGQFWIVTDLWQNFTQNAVTPATLEHLSAFCDEFLIHGVDVEGKMQGIQEELVMLLGEHSPIPATYAGGSSQFSDLERVKSLGNGRVDLTIGSALDIFGGAIPYQQVVAWHKAQIRSSDN